MTRVSGNQAELDRDWRTDFAAINCRGVTVCTFDDLQYARQWVKDRASEHDGLHVVEITIRKRVVFRPNLRVVAS